MFSGGFMGVEVIVYIMNEFVDMLSDEIELFLFCFEFVIWIFWGCVVIFWVYWYLKVDLFWEVGE